MKSLPEFQEEGVKVGRWTTLGTVEERKSDHSIYPRKYVGVRCECGTEKMVDIYSLASGGTQSCGCLQIDRSTKHGMAPLNRHTRFYRIWRGMLDRCVYPNNHAYKWYGAKGIRIEWPDFVSFKKDMLASYEEHVLAHGEIDTTIDRIDSKGNYSKDNCRWATRLEQAKNRDTQPRKGGRFYKEELTSLEERV